MNLWLSQSTKVSIQSIYITHTDLDLSQIQNLYVGLNSVFFFSESVSYCEFCVHNRTCIS